MHRNSHRIRCQVPSFRNWAMRGHSHSRPRLDSELGACGAGAPGDNLNALRDRIQASAGTSTRGTPPPAPGRHGALRLMAHIPPFESGKKKAMGKQLPGPRAWKGISGSCMLHRLRNHRPDLDPEPGLTTCLKGQWGGSH
jgi:hypothetical protein